MILILTQNRHEFQTRAQEKSFQDFIEYEGKLLPIIVCTIKMLIMFVSLCKDNKKQHYGKN